MNNQATLEKNNYILEDSFESERLADQNSSRNYRLIEELNPCDYSLSQGQVVLDAGCGNAEVTNFLLKENKEVDCKIHMRDISAKRIEDGLIRVKSDKKVSFSVGNLSEIPQLDNSFDKIFCRYVYQHLSNPQEVTNELFRTLKVGGELIIIDVNGLMFDMVTGNEKLNQMIKILRNGLSNFEAYVCGKVSGYLYKAGFQLNQINRTTKYMQFANPMDRLSESLLFQKRFSQIDPTLKEILGKDSEIFKNLFIDEILNPNSYMEYEKRIIRAVKTVKLH